MRIVSKTASRSARSWADDCGVVELPEHEAGALHVEDPQLYGQARPVVPGEGPSVDRCGPVVQIGIEAATESVLCPASSRCFP